MFKSVLAVLVLAVISATCFAGATGHCNLCGATWDCEKYTHGDCSKNKALRGKVSLIKKHTKTLSELAAENDAKSKAAALAAQQANYSDKL